jgi:hypothetical protein
MSEKSEALLQELVNIHKHEAAQAKLHRWLKFIFGTLPVFALIAFSIWSGMVMLEEFSAFLEEAPGIFEGGISDFIPL